MRGIKDPVLLFSVLILIGLIIGCATPLEDPTGRNSRITISPAVVPYKSAYKKGVKINISGKGFKPNQELALLTKMGGVISDIRYLVKPRPVTDEFGAFSVVWRIRSREFRRGLLKPGIQTILVLDEDGGDFGKARLIFEGKRRGEEERQWIKEYREAVRGGRTIRFVVGFSAGGGFDTYTRLIARHFGKHVPGNPTIVVQNRAGSGSLSAANYMYNRARPDGLTIGTFIGGPLVLRHIMGDKAIKFDGREFGWLGVPTPDSIVCVLTKASGIETVDDWFASRRPIKIGATAPGSTTYDPPKLVRKAIGLPIEFVEGYRGTAKIRLAAEAGEIDGACWAWQSIKTTWRRGIQSGNVRPILQLTLKSHSELTHVPRAIQYAKTAEARELLRVASESYSSTFRPYSLPPGVPKDRLRVLQKAFMDTMRDPQLLAVAKRARLEIDPMDGPTAAKLFTGMYELEPGMVTKLRNILVPKKRLATLSKSNS